MEQNKDTFPLFRYREGDVENGVYYECRKDDEEFGPLYPRLSTGEVISYKGEKILCLLSRYIESCY